MKSSEDLIVVARLAKRHTFKENKWKAIAVSGLAAPWLEKVESIILEGQTDSIKVKIEVPLNYSAEFFVHFPEGFEATPVNIWVARSFFPEISGNEFYISDLLNSTLQTSLGDFKLISFFENGDPVREISSVTLLLESQELIGGKKLQVEVPLSSLVKTDTGWQIKDISIWISVAEPTPESDDS